MPRSRNKNKSSQQSRTTYKKCPYCKKPFKCLASHYASSGGVLCNNIIGDPSTVSLILSSHKNYSVNSRGQSQTKSSKQLDNHYKSFSSLQPTINNIESLYTSTDLDQSFLLSPFNKNDKVTNSHQLSHVNNEAEIDIDFSYDDSTSSESPNQRTKKRRTKFDNKTKQILLDSVPTISQPVTQSNSSFHLSNTYEETVDDIAELEITPSDDLSTSSCNLVHQSSQVDDTPINTNNPTPVIPIATSIDHSTNNIGQTLQTPIVSLPSQQTNIPNTQENSTHNSQSMSSIPINSLPCMFDFRQFQHRIWYNRYEDSSDLLDLDNIIALKLLKIMTRSNIPNYLFKELMEWFEESHLLKIKELSKEGISIPRSCYDSIPKNKDKVIKELNSILTGDHDCFNLKPRHKILQLPSGRYVRHSTINLQAIVYSLISIPEILNECNSLLHNKFFRNPTLLENLPPNQRTYNDIHTGWWFLNAFKKHCSDVKDVLCPVILFIDGTAIDPVGKLKLEAVMMTLGIFSREMRNKSEAWRILGYICDPKKESLGNDDYSRKETIQKRTDYHHMLSDILQELLSLEQSDGIIINIPSKDGKSLETIRLKFSLMMIIGDAVGNDNLCDMYVSYGASSKFLCRDCDCPTSSLSDPFFKCNIVDRSQLISLSSSDLTKKCFYKIENNIFDKFNFGGDTSKINGCTPPEILHAFLMGPCEDMKDHFFSTITVPGLKTVDKVAKYISLNWHRQSSRNFPNIQIFKDGLQRSHLTGREILSQIFIIYLSLTQTYVMKQLPNIERNADCRFKMKRQKYTDTSASANSEDSTNEDSNKTALFTTVKHEFKKVGQTTNTLKRWITLLECMLCFYQWQIQPSIPFTDFEASINTTSSSHNSTTQESGPSSSEKQIQAFMSLYNEVICDRLGNGNNKAKFHWAKHLTYYAPKFGCFLNFDGGIGERNLKPKVKQPARRTQKRQYVLAKQASDRDYERTIIETMYHILSLNGQINESCNDTPSISKFPSPLNENFNTDSVSSISSSDNDSDRNYKVSGQYTIILNDDSTTIKEVRNYNNRKLKKDIFHKESLISEVMKRLQGPDYDIRCNYLSCFTTLKFTNDFYENTSAVDIEDHPSKLISFRADPWYYGKPWFDWCITSWTGDETICIDDQISSSYNNTSFFPSKIIMFIDASKMEFGTTATEDNGKLWAVVRSTVTDKRKNTDRPNIICKLMETFQMEDKIRIINCDQIHRDAYVICDSDSIQVHSSSNRQNQTSSSTTFRSKHIMNLKPIESWPKIFLNEKWM